MKCPKCGNDIPEESAACSHCGEKIDYIGLGSSFGGAVVKIHRKSERKNAD